MRLLTRINCSAAAACHPPVTLHSPTRGSPLRLQSAPFADGPVLPLPFTGSCLAPHTFPPSAAAGLVDAHGAAAGLLPRPRRRDHRPCGVLRQQPGGLKLHGWDHPRVAAGGGWLMAGLRNSRARSGCGSFRLVVGLCNSRAALQGEAALPCCPYPRAAQHHPPSWRYSTPAGRRGAPRPASVSPGGPRRPHSLCGLPPLAAGCAAVRLVRWHVPHLAGAGCSGTTHCAHC